MTRFSLASDSFGQEEIEAAIAVLRSGRYTMGERVRQFEQAFAEWVGAEHAVMVNSGSSANLLLIDSLLRRSTAQLAPLRPGDEVLVPAVAWPTTVAPIVQLGLIPVFVDVDPDTLAISLESAASALSKKTRAMFMIHVLGYAADTNRYLDFCKNKELLLLEDCCESFGAFAPDKKHVGTQSYGGAFSHFFSHHLTTMEGGSIATNDAALADDLRSARAHGWIRDRSDKAQWQQRFPDFDDRFFFVMPGYNLRPMEIQAAIGLVQLKRMDEFLQSREQVARRVSEWTQTYTPWLRMYGAETLGQSHIHKHDRRHSWMNLPFILRDDAPYSVQEVKQTFETEGVDTRPLIAGNFTRHPAARYGAVRVAPQLVEADRVLQRAFMIGCHPFPSEESMDCVARALRRLGSHK